METGLVVSSVLLWIIILFNLVLTFALIRKVNAKGPESSQTQMKALKTGEEAPAFTAQTLSGETVTNATYSELNTAFVFISTHCRPCREILPMLEELAPQAAHSGVEIVLVSSNTLAATNTFVSEMDIHLPVLVAPHDTNPFTNDYKSTNTPSYCLVNEQGKVQSAGYPSMEWGEWKMLTKSWQQNGVSLSRKR